MGDSTCTRFGICDLSIVKPLQSANRWDRGAGPWVESPCLSFAQLWLSMSICQSEIPFGVGIMFPFCTPWCCKVLFLTEVETQRKVSLSQQRNRNSFPNKGPHHNYFPFLLCCLIFYFLPFASSIAYLGLEGLSILCRQFPFLYFICPVLVTYSLGWHIRSSCRFPPQKHKLL